MDLTKDIKNLDCYLNHEMKEVDGFCINAKCCQQPQFCCQCQKTIHQSHFKDCMSFKEIIAILYELYQKLLPNQDKIQQIYKQIEVALILIKKRQSAKITNEEIQMEELKNIIELQENHFQIYKTQLIHIVDLLEIKNYGEIRNQIRIIKHLYHFSQNKIDQLTQFLMDFFDFFKIIKTSLQINLKLDYRSQQITKEMIESLKKTVNDYIIYNIDFTNSTIIKNYTLKQLELISQPIQFTDQSIQTQKETEKSFNFFEFRLNEDDSSQANEIPEENYSLDEFEIFQLKYQYLTQHFIEEIDNNNLNSVQEIITFNQLTLEILIVENLLQQSGIIKWIYNINDQNEFQFFDSSNDQISDQIQEFNQEQIIQQPGQIDQQNTNEEQNNLAYQEQNQLDRLLLSYDNQMLVVQQYHNQQQYEQNENMNQDLDYEENRIIEIQQIH